MHRLTAPRIKAATLTAAVAIGVASASWVIATGRIDVTTYAIRALAVLGLLAAAEWAYDLTHAARRRHAARQETTAMSAFTDRLHALVAKFGTVAKTDVAEVEKALEEKVHPIVNAVKDEVSAEVAAVKLELKTDVTTVEQQLKTQLAAAETRVAALEAQVAQLLKQQPAS